MSSGACLFSWRVVFIYFAILLVFLVIVGYRLPAQDGTAALLGAVSDASGARIAGAEVRVALTQTGASRAVVTDAEGRFSFAMLAPGTYTVTATAKDMRAETQPVVDLVVGAATQIEFHLVPAARTDTMIVSAQISPVDTQSSEVSQEIVEHAIQNLPLNGRRFTDLALLTPGVTQDPRGQTSDTNGDLSFGGVRGLQNNFLVDGADNNNAFFAQARGRYRAPYQFSNEVIKEFRVSSNSYSAELGRAGGAVFNVVTKSGGNDIHGTGFYYLRDRIFDAQPAFAPFKPESRQQQLGGTVSGPIRRNRAFFYAGFDESLQDVPSIMQFGKGRPDVVAGPDDYDYKDRALVESAVQQLNTLGGEYPTTMRGNAGMFKVDITPSSKHLVFVRLNTSRYSGTNNVFFSASSPLTTYAESSNGSEDVKTETLAGSLTSIWTTNVATHLRAQFSRDLQQSFANSEEPKLKIYGILDGAGRSTMLPRQTRERKLQVADTLDKETPRISWKVGFDFMQGWIYNYYPSQSGGEYYFDNLRVNPWTFVPMKYGEPLTPLRAFAHEVPRYYIQSFGTAVSNPDFRSYSFFLQDGFRVTRNLTINAGIRFDLQTFQVDGLETNPLYAPSGKVPSDSNNFSPRVGFAFSPGGSGRWVLRGGAGRFYSQVPSVYASQVQTDNGLQQSELFLDNMKPQDAVLFPNYPEPLVRCPSGTLNCVAPAAVASHLETQVSAFATNFQTPYTDQASATLEHQLGKKWTATASYLYVHGEHLIRSLDVNLPPPIIERYPVYNDDSSVFLGQYMQVQSFGTWQTRRSVTCPYPPCINDVQRPIAELGTINSFESEASSVYNGGTLSLKRQVNQGLFVRAAYTWAKAVDDGADALVVGRPGNVQNAYSVQLERGLSVTDQRHRLVGAAVWEPRRFVVQNNWLDRVVNGWKLSSIVTVGSGRPVNATTAGDGNRDGNTYNDRLPGYRRNSFIGPDYLTCDLRVSRSMRLGEKVHVQLLAESFNVSNRLNRRVTISDDGYLNSAGQFVPYSNAVNGKVYPGQFLKSSNFLVPTNAYAPRQLQFSARLNF